MATHTSPPPSTRCLCATVRRAARLLTRRYEEALRPAGLTPSQFELMKTLSHAGPCTQSALVRLLETDQTTLSRNLRPLERERWVASLPDNTDARRRLYRVTGLGGSVLAEADRCWRAVHQQIERQIGEPVAAIWLALDRILAAARTSEPQ